MLKKIIFFSILLLSNTFIYSQSEGFSKILARHSSDSILIQQLKKFAARGIEKQLNVRTISPKVIIDTAKTFLGTPHCMGGTTYKCIDCSGLLQASFGSVGIFLPHSSEDIARFGKIIPDTVALQPGDLVFFIRTYKTSRLITHAGIYLGQGNFIHTSFSKGVIISNLSENYYKKHYIFGTRIFLQ